MASKVTKTAVKKFKEAFQKRVDMTLAKDLSECNKHDLYMALAYTVRDLQVEAWKKTNHKLSSKDAPKRMYYISLEFLMGRTLGNSLINCGFFDQADSALKELGVELEDLLDEEMDAGLGNGGLGRLAACFLDSIASLDLPGFGSGIRYDYGIFRQKIDHGHQVEEPDNWLRFGNPWEVVRPERKRVVKFYGHVECYKDHNGKQWCTWVDTEDVLAMPYDTPIPGFSMGTVNTLRLWSARSIFGFNLKDFNQGDFINANIQKSLTENITKVLYPNDNNYEGKELRLKQQYFLAAATLADMIEDFKELGLPMSQLPKKAVCQLNDTHPAIAVPELMRILMDDEGLTWDEAWTITRQVFAYTNHTLLSEALEKWSVGLIENLLPRHMQIIYEINYHFLREVAQKYPGDNDRQRDMSIIQEGGEKMVRMAYLAIVGSFSVNGVAAMHTELLKHDLVRDFYDLYPEKFNNKTNGITPRRWLRKCNPELSELITSKIGEKWVTDLDELKKLIPFAKDKAFRKEISKIKKNNKIRLAEYVKNLTGDELDVNSIFDIQVKRLHEYKRQLLNILHAIHLYQKIKANPKGHYTPRTIIIAGKAAPGYYMAKLIIKMVNSVSAIVNNDPEVNKFLKVLFLPNYSVSMAEVLVPATDLSEQISTAGKEASGTGNMKFALNGALTIGTLDGANVEIKDAVGDDNIYIFGLDVDGVTSLNQNGYNPHDYMPHGSHLANALDLISSGFFCPEEPELFRPLVDSLTIGGDHYKLAADFEGYADSQELVSNDFIKEDDWAKRAILNIANMGGFSSDRTIKQYAEEIWDIKPY
jgi:glycogen phosphorylase